jgi:transposase
VTVSPFTNVKVSIYNDIATTFCLSWEHDSARYHLWIDRHNYTIEADPTFRRPTLYMNPPPNVLPGMDGYFRTRKLDACKQSGAPWRDLPKAFGPYTTCYNRFVRWRQAGVWSRIIDALAAAHDAAVQMIDTSIVRVHQHAACIARNKRQSMGRSRGGLTSKIHAVVDTNGLPVQLALTPGEAHDNRLAGKLLSRLKSGTMLLADRGYDADWIRALAAKRGVWANIPPRCHRNDPICFSPYLYRGRNLIERFFNKIKQCRRVATRYDKLAANYLAFIQLASIRLWLRINEFTP